MDKIRRYYYTKLQYKVNLWYNKRAMTIIDLKERVKTFPANPGVYLFIKGNPPSPKRFGVAKENIYIGKAASLKARLNSYLKTEDHRIRTMISQATKVDYIETQSEIEALILESQLIKQKRPMFNIMLRDDKQYFYITFSGDEFPRISYTHQPQDKQAIGPFTDGASLKATLRLLRSVFPYCTCRQMHHNFCLNYHIGKCIGFCCLKNPESKVSSSELTKIRKTYLENIKAIKSILSGKRADIIKQFSKDMDKVARSGKLEEAIALRSRIEKLERIFENAQIIKSSEILKKHAPFLHSLIRTNKGINRIECYDISNIQGKHATGSMVTFVNGEADKNFYRKFNIKTVHNANDTAMLQEIVGRRLRHEEWPFPDLIVVDGGKGQVNAVNTILKEQSVLIPVVGLVKNEKHIGHAIILPNKKEALPLSKLTEHDRNLLVAIDAEAHRFAISHYRHKHRNSFM